MASIRYRIEELQLENKSLLERLSFLSETTPQYKEILSKINENNKKIKRLNGILEQGFEL